MQRRCPRFACAAARACCLGLRMQRRRLAATICSALFATCRAAWRRAAARRAHVACVRACRAAQERGLSVAILFGGTSGCGKSTLASLLASRMGITTVSRPPARPPPPAALPVPPPPGLSPPHACPVARRAPSAASIGRVIWRVARRVIGAWPPRRGRAGAFDRLCAAHAAQVHDRGRVPTPLGIDVQRGTSGRPQRALGDGLGLGLESHIEAPTRRTTRAPWRRAALLGRSGLCRRRGRSGLGARSARSLARLPPEGRVGRIGSTAGGAARRAEHDGPRAFVAFAKAVRPLGLVDKVYASRGTRRTLKGGLGRSTRRLKPSRPRQ